MITRYTTPEMEKIWSEKNKFEIWKQVELTVTEILFEKGIVPQKSWTAINNKADFNIKRVKEIEKETRHDVIAFLTNMAEYIGPDSRYVHMGMTSSDLLDTSLALQCREAGLLIMVKLKKFHEVLKTRAIEFKHVFQMGRSHGIHAEPITFGLKLALWSEEISRNISRWEKAIKAISTGQFSGAVGTFQHLDPEVELEACKRLNLTAATVSNQVVQRDGHAEYLTTLAIIGSTLEKIAVEIRHLQRTEVLEAEEFFKKGQKGSSAMPHKRNPIVTERITGMARLLRGNAHVALENVALWHERDISHSSVERIIFPDSTIIMDYSLMKMIDIIENLLVYPKNMMKNINLTCGLIYSQEVLLSLIKKGLTREDAYSLVQKNSMIVWEKRIDFKDVLLNDEKVSTLFTREELEKLFDMEKIKYSVDKIFKKIGLV